MSAALEEFFPDPHDHKCVTGLHRSVHQLGLVCRRLHEEAIGSEAVKLPAEAPTRAFPPPRGVEQSCNSVLRHSLIREDGEMPGPGLAST